MTVGRRVRESGRCLLPVWELRLNWNHRRHSWRILLFYKLLAIVCACGVVLTFILHALISSSFFTNYRCGRRAKFLIKKNFVAVMVIAGSIGLLGLLTSRIIALFITHTLGEFKPSWMSRIGFLVKWLPWLISLCLVSMIVLSITSMSWVFAEPPAWCKRRWSPAGLQAVRNCRIWFSWKAPCVSPAEREELPRDYDSCNDGDYLTNNSFLFFAQKEAGSECSFNVPIICVLYKDYFSSLASKTNPDLSLADSFGCMGSAAKGLTADVFMAEAASDLYRYLVIYACTWCLSLAAMLLLFFYIKYSSHFESYFCQPAANTDNYILPFFRPLTPWNAGTG